MYGEGNSSRLVGDIINSTVKITDGLTEATGVDIKSILSGFLGGKIASAPTEASAETADEVSANPYEEVAPGDYIIDRSDYEDFTTDTTDTTIE